MASENEGGITIAGREENPNVTCGATPAAGGQASRDDSDGDAKKFTESVNEKMDARGSADASEDTNKNEDDSIGDSSSGSFTESGDDEEDDSDTDFSPARGDPEVLLIKANALKDEGNNYFKEKDYEKASRSYRRGTNALKPLNRGNTGDEQVKALLVSLQTNLSMMCFKLDKHKQSCEVATAALKIDNTNVKARYRRAVAFRKLGDHDKARSDLREALKFDPANNTVKKELASLKKEIEDSKQAQKKSLQKAFSKGGGLLYDDKEKEKRRKEEQDRLQKKREEEALKKRKVEWEDECVKRMARGEPAVSFEDWEAERKEKEKAVAKQKAAEEKRNREERKKAREAVKSEESESEDELTEKELAQLRGYKKTADGRITSYFTREQSSQERTMIGDITPRRLDAKHATAPTDPSGAQGKVPLEPPAGNKGNPSAWNQAGTWEEKDTTEWCRERLMTRLQETKIELGGLTGNVTEVKDMSGDASVAIVAGKKRYIFDFHCKLKFQVREANTDDLVATGSLTLPDICSTHHEELEVAFRGWKKVPTKNHEQEAAECQHGLISEVRESVKLWVEDFNNTY